MRVQAKPAVRKEYTLEKMVERLAPKARTAAATPKARPKRTANPRNLLDHGAMEGGRKWM